MNDVAYNAVDYPIFVTTPTKSGWVKLDGVSFGIPQWAGLIADADQDRASAGKSVLAGEGLLDGIYLAAWSHEPAPGDDRPGHVRRRRHRGLEHLRGVQRL